MLPGDWYMLGITAVVVGGFAYRLRSEQRAGISQIRADLTASRARIALGFTLLLALLLFGGGVLLLLSDGVTTGHGRLFAGVRLHFRAGAPLLLACAAFFVYVARQHYRRVSGARDIAPAAFQHEPDGALLSRAKVAWSDALPGPDPRALSEAVRALLSTGWGAAPRASIDELARSLESRGQSRAAVLARALLTDLDAAIYGGAIVSARELDERFAELARIAGDDERLG